MANKKNLWEAEQDAADQLKEYYRRKFNKPK